MTAEDILADAVRLTKIYAQQLHVESRTPQVRVYVLRRNDQILGIFAQESRAVEIAVEIMANSSAWQQWTQIAPTRWEAGGTTLYINAHEVQ